MAAKPREASAKALKAARNRQEEEHERLKVKTLLKMNSPYNPRGITDEQFEKLKSSLQTFGVAEPACINVRTSHIVGGHQRIKAAESIGWETFPVWYVDKSLEEEKALNAALNNPNLQGHYIDELLGLVFTDLAGDTVLLDATGFTVQEREIIVDGWDTDYEALNKVSGHTEGIAATIFIECAQADKERVHAKLSKYVSDLGIDGCRVR